VSAAVRKAVELGLEEPLGMVERLRALDGV